MEFEDWTSRLVDPQQHQSGVASRCPGHDDRVRSLMSNLGDHGGIVVKCHAGCKTEDIVTAMALSMADLMGRPYVVDTYDYTDKSGAQVLFKVQRWANPKTFRCVPGLPPPAERVLFTWPAIEWAREHGRTLFVVEGERDVLTLAGAGVPATTNVGGAGAWLPHYNEVLAGLNVIVVADNDEPGRRHARSVAFSLKGFAATVSVMHSPYGKDVTDLLDAGYTVDRLMNLPDEEGTSVYTAASVTTRKVAWAWHQYFPLGKLSIIEGDPGDGKSVLTVDLAARWSTGAPMPGALVGLPPTTVILVSAEDDMDDTIVPRLRRAGANLERVKLVPHGPTPDKPFDFARDLAGLAKVVADLDAKVVVFDPLSAFMGEQTDTHNDASVRRALQPLKAMATLTGAAVLVVRHLTKGSAGGKALYRGGGSIGFIGAARAAYLVADLVDDPGTKAFACVKNNLAPKPPTLTYKIEAVDDEPYVVWGEALDMGAQAILDGPERKKSPEQDDELSSRRMARQARVDFLLDVVAGGPLTWAEICAFAKAAGFNSVHMLENARAEAGLLKIYGTDGARTVQWGRPISTTESNPASPVPPFPVPTASRSAMEMERETVEREGGDDSLYPDGTTDDDRDQQLAALPRRCDVCQTEDAVMGWGKPYWVMRCPDHNPRTYGPQL